MAKRKTTSVVSSGNGFETVKTESSSVQASGDELAVLRDILIGSHVRSSEQSVGELQTQLEALRDEFAARLNDVETSLTNELQEFTKKANQRDERLNGKLRQMDQLLEAEKETRTSLGQLLIELGRRLQDIDPEADAT